MQRYVFLMKFTLQITLFESTNLGLDNINIMFFLKVLEFAKKNNIELKPRNIPGMPSMAGFNPGGSDGGDTSGEDSTGILRT